MQRNTATREDNVMRVIRSSRLPPNHCQRLSHLKISADLQNRSAPDLVHSGSVMVQYQYQDWFKL